MDDDFDNDMGLPDEEIGGSIEDVADVGAGGLEDDLEPGVGEAGGTRSSGGARARQSKATTPRAPKAAVAAPKKKSSSKPKPKKKAAKKKGAKKKAKGASKSARKASRKSGKKAAKRKK